MAITKAAKCHACGSIDPVKRLVENSPEYFSYVCERCKGLKNPVQILEHLEVYKEAKPNLGEELLPCGACGVQIKDCTCCRRCKKCRDVEYSCTCGEFEPAEQVPGTIEASSVVSKLFSDLEIELKDLHENR